MAIKATFENNKNETTVEGLYQWDYGQVLEIESLDFGTEIVEVHFACTNMTEAIVRPCTMTRGVGSVVIPDDCLEQTTSITAWVYTIECPQSTQCAHDTPCSLCPSGTQGKTRKVIHIPVIKRTRPSARRDIPQDISDRYTELITEVNKAVNDLESGATVVERARSAKEADHSVTAGNAASASYATSAGGANTANVAQHLTSPYLLNADIYAPPILSINITEPGFYMVGFQYSEGWNAGFISISKEDLINGCNGPACGETNDGILMYPTYDPNDGLYVGTDSSKCRLSVITRIVAYDNK